MRPIPLHHPDLARPPTGDPPALKPRKLTRLGSLVIVALAIAGCGSSQSPAAASTGPTVSTGPVASVAAAPTGATGKGAAVKDPCSLLTADEISAAVGYTVAAGKLNASGTACLWQGQTAIGAQLVIETGGESAFKTESAIYGGATPVSGIGDEAVQGTGTEAVVFRKGDIVVAVGAGNATTGAAVVLAKLVASRL